MRCVVFCVSTSFPRKSFYHLSGFRSPRVPLRWHLSVSFVWQQQWELLGVSWTSRYVCAICAWLFLSASAHARARMCVCVCACLTVSLCVTACVHECASADLHSLPLSLSLSFFLSLSVLDISKPSLPTPFTLFFGLFLSYGPFTYISFHKFSRNSPLSHSVLPVLFLPYWSFQLYISF